MQIYENPYHMGDLTSYFQQTFPDGIAYKTFGRYYASPEDWKIEENSIIISKELDLDARSDCSYGINVATLEWIFYDFIEDSSCEAYAWDKFNTFQIWKVKILEDSVVVVPNREGKIRTNKIQILEKLDMSQLEDLFEELVEEWGFDEYEDADDWDEEYD